MGQSFAATKRVRPHLFLLSLLLGVALSSAAQEAGLYRSNEEFLPISEIEESDRERYTYVLEVTVAPRRVERFLYREGELFRRQVERLSATGLPQERMTYDAAEELVETARYRYDPRGRLRSVEVRSGTEIERLVAGAGEESFSTDREGGNRRTIYRYDGAGRLVTRLTYADSELQEEVRREYTEGTVALRVAEYPQTRRQVISRYNADGLLAEEETYEAGRLEQRRLLSYDESDRLVREVIRGRETREVEYAYREDGELLEREELINGQIRRRVRYEEGGRVELRFRQGEPFLRVYFREDARVREEVLRDGRIIEVREFEDG